MSNDLYNAKSEIQTRREKQLHLRKKLLEIENNRRAGVKDFDAKSTVAEFRVKIGNLKSLN